MSRRLLLAGGISLLVLLLTWLSWRPGVDGAEDVPPPTASPPAAGVASGEGPRTVAEDSEGRSALPPRNPAPESGAPSGTETGPRGTVVALGSEHPLPDVAIHALAPEPGPAAGELLARTDAEGAFVLERAPGPGRGLLFRKPGHFDQRLPAPDLLALLEAAAGGVLAPIHLAVEGRVAVRVQLPDGSAAPSTAVRAYGLAPRPAGVGVPAGRPTIGEPAEGRTDAGGRCELGPLPCGVPIALDLGPQHVFLRTVRVDPRLRTLAVAIEYAPPGTVRGLVQDAAGRPAAGAAVVLGGGPLVDRTATTDNEGHYRFETVSPGRVSVRPATIGVPAASGVLEPGGELELEPLRLPRRARFSARLRWNFARAPQGLAVELFRDGERLGPRHWMSADGRLEVEVPPGPLRVEVTQHRGVLLAVAGGSFEPHSLEELGRVLSRRAAAPAEGLELWLDAGLGSLAGELPGSGAGTLQLDLYPAGAGELQARGRPLHSQTGIALGGGRFASHPVLPGRYALALRVAGGPDGGARRHWLPEVEIAAGGVTDLGRLPAPGLGGLEVRVRDAAGEPRPGAVVSLSRLPAASSGEAPEALELVADGPRGAARFADLAPGPVELRARLAGPGGELRSARRVVPLPPGGELQVELVLEASAALGGQVLRGGFPQAGFEVTLGRRDAEGEIKLESAETADGSGRFRFADLDPDQYVLLAGPEGRWLRLPPGADRELVVELGADPVELQILRRSEPLWELRHVRVVQLGPGPGRTGAFAYAELLGAGRLRFERPPGPCLLLLRLDGTPRSQHLAVVYDAPPGVPSDLLRLSELPLEVELSPAAALGPPPVLELVGFAPDLEPPLLPCHLAGERMPDGRGWRFPCLPAGALLKLTATGSDGLVVEHELDTVAGLPLRVSVL